MLKEIQKNSITGPFWHQFKDPTRRCVHNIQFIYNVWYRVDCLGKVLLCLASIILKLKRSSGLLRNFWPLLCSLSINELNGPPTHTCRAHSALMVSRPPPPPLLKTSFGVAEDECAESCRSPFHCHHTGRSWTQPVSKARSSHPQEPQLPLPPFHFLFFHFPSEGEFGHKRGDMKATSSFLCDTSQIEMKTTETATRHRHKRP